MSAALVDYRVEHGFAIFALNNPPANPSTYDDWVAAFRAWQDDIGLDCHMACVAELTQTPDWLAPTKTLV